MMRRFEFRDDEEGYIAECVQFSNGMVIGVFDGELVGFADLVAAMEAGEEHDGHIVWIDNVRTPGDRSVPEGALKHLMQVAAYVSRGRSFVDVGPYPDATARIALGALPDELLDLIREAPDA